MFPQFAPQMQQQGFQQGDYGVSAMSQQNNRLLGAPQMQAAQNVTNLTNSTAPSSSTTQPQVANMVKALQGGR